MCLRNQLKANLKNRKFSKLLLGAKLPEAVGKYIARCNQNEQEGWEAWFRWKMFRYGLHKASYGAANVELLVRLKSDDVDKSIAKAMRLGRECKYDLAHDRPLNQVVQDSGDELDWTGAGMESADEIRDIISYISLAGMIAELLASGARIQPSLKIATLIDIGTHSEGIWEYPVPTVANKLGA